MEHYCFFKKKEDLRLVQEQQLIQDILYLHLLLLAQKAQLREKRIKKCLMLYCLKYHYHKQRRRQHQHKRWHLSFYQEKCYSNLEISKKNHYEL